MGRMRSIAKKRATKAHLSLPSSQSNATLNRAGGVAFDITNPAVKLITMCGGSFFMEPRYYNADSCVPKRDPKGKFGKLEQRIQIAKNKALSGSKVLKVENCSELNDVSMEVLAAAWDVLNSEFPSDLLKIANWLRNAMNIRLTPQVLLVLASQHPNGQPFVREYTPKIVVRPDEVKTCILMHRFFFGMKSLKNCLYRGLADALHKFGERGLIKYEGKDFPSWKDVLFMVHRSKDYPLTKPVAEYFMFGKADEQNTPVAYKRKLLAKCKEFNAEAKKLVTESFANWEVVLSQFGQADGNKKRVWEYLIDQNLVGYMALMRNLRNLLEAGVGDKAIQKVYDKLSDPQEIARCRQLPFRFAMAREVLDPIARNSWYDDDRHSPVAGSTAHRNKLVEALENAADEAVVNVPQLPGLTVVFADNSGSMDQKVSEKSKVSCAMASNVLAGIVAKRSSDARICAFGTDVAEVRWTKRTRVMEFVQKISEADTKGCSTNGYRCAQWLMSEKIKADRVILLSDMQCWDTRGGGWGRNYDSLADEWFKYKKTNENCWLHCVNVNGYGDSVVDEKSDKVNLVGAFSEKIINMLLVTEGVDVGEALPSLEQIRAEW